MSKGSLFWNRGKGKLGEVVLSTVKGQAVARAYQPTVANPKTSAQINQRATFAAAVKFFKFSTQNLFKFAFEDRRQVESDYNAYMRYNAKRFAVMPREAFLNTAILPVLKANNVVMSQGRLGEVNINPIASTTPTANQLYTFDNEISFEDVPTWGDVSSALIEAYNLIAGDILTFVEIEAFYGGYDWEDVTRQPAWHLEQAILDPTSTAVVPAWIDLTSDDRLVLKGSVNPTMTKYACAIFSRNTETGLWTSTSFLTQNAAGAAATEHMLDPDIIKANLKSWGAAEDAILQGALAEPMPTPPVGPTFTEFRGTKNVQADAFNAGPSAKGYPLASQIVEQQDSLNVFVKGDNLNLVAESDFTCNIPLADLDFVNATSAHPGYWVLAATVDAAAELEETTTAILKYKGETLFTFVVNV